MKACVRRQPSAFASVYISRYHCVLAASMRHPRHMTEAALAGAHIATVPFKILQQMVHHPLTDKGIVQFRKDWESARHAGAPGSTAKAKTS